MKFSKVMAFISIEEKKISNLAAKKKLKRYSQIRIHSLPLSPPTLSTRCSLPWQHHSCRQHQRTFHQKLRHSQHHHHQGIIALKLPMQIYFHQHHCHQIKLKQRRGRKSQGLQKQQYHNQQQINQYINQQIHQQTNQNVDYRTTRPIDQWCS